VAAKSNLTRTILRAALTVAGVAFGIVAYVYLTLPDVRPLATTNPATTAFMELREREAKAAGRTLRHEHRWIPYSRISPNLKRAVLVAEDSAFWDHEGVDFEQLSESIKVNLRRGAAVRGASTITQQLAKNLYLSPSRDPLRKLRELIIARRLEASLSKTRIFELYLNLIEWGDGVWGAEAAARVHFGVSASALSREQAALLAGSIINPRRYSPSRPPRRLQRRQRTILANMRLIEPAPPAERKTKPAPPVIEPLDDDPPTDGDDAPEAPAPADAPTSAAAGTATP
jgi:monofunctional biosynthetic peptidoglycan transglycosylase